MVSLSLSLSLSCRKKLFLAFILSVFLLFPISPAYALRICDSTTSDCGRSISTKTALIANRNVTAITKDVMPIGTIIAWFTEGMPSDPDKWLECDGRAVDKNEYPELYVMMHNTPNFNGRFLRAGGKNVLGNTHDDTIKSHDSLVAPHTHEFEGVETSVALTGTAAGQDLSSGIAKGQKYMGTGEGESGLYLGGQYATDRKGNMLSKYEEFIYQPGMEKGVYIDTDLDFKSISNFYKTNQDTINMKNKYQKFIDKADVLYQEECVGKNLFRCKYEDDNAKYTMWSESTSSGARVIKYDIIFEKSAISVWKRDDYFEFRYYPSNFIDENVETYIFVNKGKNPYNSAFTSADYYYGAPVNSKAIRYTNATKLFDIASSQEMQLADTSLSGYGLSSNVTGESKKFTPAGTVKAPADDLTAHFEGGTETAPKHIYVRYLIRAKK